MTVFTHLPPEEIERRRLASLAAMKERDKAEFERWYQEKCDRDYWTYGKCCAGCDHWSSEGGNSGQCDANGILPADEVLASVGVIGWSGPRVPGFPFTASDFVCGLFKDDFDWSTLDREYLERIGAMKRGKLRDKP